MRATIQVTFTLYRDIFSASQPDPDHFVADLRLAAAVKGYELGVVSQSKAAEIAGITRVEFINELTSFKVTPFQTNPDEITMEVEG